MWFLFTANQTVEDKEVVFGHRHTQKWDAKFLCLDNIFQKLYRPNMYDIGGTYVDTVPDLWFSYKTERCGNIFLLHIFTTSHQEEFFSLIIFNSNNIILDKKTGHAFLDDCPKYFGTEQKKLNPNYVTTYNFSEFDVDTLKDKTLFIRVSLTEKKNVDHNSKAIHDFVELLTDPVASDFTIESFDGTTFKVHKSILSVQSDVFKAMFKNDTAESQNNYVKMSDVDACDLRNILEYMYTGSISEPDNCDFSSLLLKADQYNLPGLFKLSNLMLKHDLTVDNAIQTLLLADMANCLDLKLFTLKFIKKHLHILDKSFIREIGDKAVVTELFEFILPVE